MRQRPAPSLPPDRGMDALRDAIAAVKCCATDDSEGLHAILMGTGDPRGALGMLAAITAGILANGGLPGQASGPLLDDVGRQVADGLLDLMAAAGTGGPTSA